MFRDPEGALCSCLTQTDPTSPKFLTGYRPAHGLGFCSSVARKWKNTGYLFQTSEQQPEPLETECRLHLTGQSQFQKPRASQQKRKHSQIHNTSLRRDHASLLARDLSTAVCQLTKGSFSPRMRGLCDRGRAQDGGAKPLPHCVILNQPPSQRMFHMCGMQINAPLPKDFDVFGPLEKES